VFQRDQQAAFSLKAALRPVVSVSAEAAECLGSNHGAGAFGTVVRLLRKSFAFPHDSLQMPVKYEDGHFQPHRQIRGLV
jgi:hypothetical protein